MKITIVLGSTRIGRNSGRVCLALQKELGKRGEQAEIIDVKDWPIHQFEERVAVLPDAPGALSKLADQMKGSDALIFVTPEYNGSFTGSLKNFIDSFSREEYARKPIGVATVATGKMGGIRAAYQLQQVILGLGAYPLSQMLLTSEVLKNIDETGEIQTDTYAGQMHTFLGAFLDFAQTLKRGRVYPPEE